MLRILVVDDEEIVHRSLERARNKGRIDADLLHAQDGLEAIDVLEKSVTTPSPDGPISGVLLDINMPAMDGFEFLTKIRADERFKQLTIVMLSSSDEQSDIVRATNLGADNYRIKDSANALVDAVRMLEEALDASST